MTSQRTILIVDDNTEDCATYRRYLTREGGEVYGVVVAHTGREALRLFEENVPDCVLLDHLMPDMDGLKVLASLTDSEGKVTCPVLMMTGSANPAVAVKAIKSGAEDYLVKGEVTSDTLHAAIANAIEKRAFQQVLEESRAQFEAAFIDAAIGMALVAPDGHWLRVNPAFTLLLGYPEAEFLATDFQSFTHPDDLSKDMALMQQSLEGGLHTYQVEKRYLHKDGQIVWAFLSASLVRDPQGQPLYFVSQVQDITESKRLQQEIVDLNARLRRTVTESHHRIKNNLQMLSAMVEIRTPRIEQTVSVEELKRIRQHILSLATLHDVLTLEAKVTADHEGISLKIALEKLGEMLQATAGNRNVIVKAEDMTATFKQGISFSLLVNELVSNALKHGKGDVDLTLKKVSATSSGANLETETENLSARLEVCDDGDGFPPDFDPQKAANTGLDLIKSLGQWDLRGEIVYANREEGGARVSVVFPLPDQSAYFVS